MREDPVERAAVQDRLADLQGGRVYAKAQRVAAVLAAIEARGEATMLEVVRDTRIASSTIWFLITDLEAQNRIHIKRWHDNSARYVVGPGVSAKRQGRMSKTAPMRLPAAERAMRAANAAHHNELMDAFFGRNV